MCLGFNTVKPYWALCWKCQTWPLTFSCSAVCQTPITLPRVLLKKLPDEALGKLACIAEELFIKIIVHRRDISQCLLLRVTKERWRTTQAETAAKKTFTRWLRPSLIISYWTLRSPFIITNHPNLQYICDDSNAPVKEQHKVNPKLCTEACCMDGSRVRGN